MALQVGSKGSNNNILFLQATVKPAMVMSRIATQLAAPQSALGTWRYTNIQIYKYTNGRAPIMLRQLYK